MNHSGQPVERQRRREPVVRPSIPCLRDHMLKPSCTRPVREKWEVLRPTSGAVEVCLVRGVHRLDGGCLHYPNL